LQSAVLTFITEDEKMKNTLLTTCLMGLLAVSGLMAPSTAKADPPGMMRHQMDDDDMMRYGRMGSSWERGMMRGPMMMGGMMMEDFSDLKLSKEQRDKIRSIMQEQRKTHLEMMNKMFDASDKLSELYDADSPDADKIGKAYDDVFAVQKQMIQENLRARNKIFATLTKEQQEKFRARANPRRFGMMYE